MSRPVDQGTPATGKALEERLRDRDDAVWAEASESLGLLACRSSRARQRLLALAQSPSRLWRMKSLPGLGRLAAAHPAGLAALARLSEDPDGRLREAAARSLGSAAATSGQAWEMLIACSRGEDPHLRAGVAAGFSDCAASRPDALKHIKALTTDPHGPVRASAAIAAAEAARSGVRGASTLLRALCSRSENDEHICQGLARGLSGLLSRPSATAMSIVNMLVNMPGEAARWCAAAALSGLPHQARNGKAIAGRLARDPSGLVRSRLAQSLGESAPRWGPLVLIPLARDPDRFVAAAAVDGLGSFASCSTVLDLLIEFARSQHEHLRAAAAHGLGKAAAYLDVTAALEALASDPRSSVRQATASALATCGASADAWARSLLHMLAADPEPRVRAAAVRSMGELRDERALLAVARDRSPAVRLAAAQSLRRLADQPTALAALCGLLSDSHCRGTAAALVAEALEEDPARLREVLKVVLASPDAKAAFASLASASGDERLARAFDALLAMFEEPDISRAARLAGERLAACRVAACGEFASFARLVERACSARDVCDVAQAQPAVASLARSDFLASVGEAVWVSLINAARAAALAEQARGGADERTHFASASAALEQACAELAAAEGLARRVVSGIITSWDQAIRGAQADASQRGDLRVVLLSGLIMRRRVVEVSLLVENIGQAAARDVRLEVSAQQGFAPLDADVEVGVLEPGAVAERSFSMRCPARATAGELKVTAHWSDLRKRRRTFLQAFSVASARRRFAPVSNPYMPGKPLEADSPMFFGRGDVFDTLRDSLRGAHQCNVVGLIGLRRTGKTSIAKRLHAALGDSYLPVFVDVQGLLVDSLPLLYYQLAGAAGEALRSQDIVMDGPDRDDAQDPGFLERYIQEAAKRARGRRLLIVLDEYDDLEPKVRAGLLPEALFSYLRHLMQHAPNVAFLLCGTHRVEELDPRYWSTLFNLAIYHRLGRLDDASAHDLVVKPLRAAGLLIEDMAAENVLRLCGGQPYLLQIAGHCIVSYVNESRRTAIAADDVGQFSARLLSAAAGHLRYLWELGSVEEQAVLGALAHRWPHDPWLTPQQIQEATSRTAPGLEPAAIEASLQHLIEKDLVRTVGSAAARYCLSVGLLALWARSGEAR